MSKKVVGVIIGVVVAAIIIGSVLMLMYYKPLRPAPPSYASLVKASEYARYEGLYALHLSMHMRATLLTRQINASVLIGGLLTVGQDTYNRSYLSGSFMVTLSPTRGISYTVALPLEVAYLLNDSKIKICYNVTVRMLGKVSVARCNITNLKSAYAKLVELREQMLKELEKHLKYIGTEKIAGLESYCYAGWVVLNVSKYMLKPRKTPTMIMLPKMPQVYNLTIEKVCYTTSGILTEFKAYMKPITSGTITITAKISLVLKKVKPGYFNEKLFKELLSLPVGPPVTITK